MQKRWYPDISFKFFVSQYQKITLGNISVYQKFSGIQNFLHKKGISLNSVENFLFHCADKNRRRTLLCFERILVSKFFKQTRGEDSQFRQNFFFSQDRKNFAGETFFVLENFWNEKPFIQRRGLYHGFRAKIFLSDCTKMFRWRTLSCFRKTLFSKFLMHRRRGASRFHRTVLCLTGPKRKAF